MYTEQKTWQKESKSRKMQKEQLEKIIEIANTKAIKGEILKNGFLDCVKVKQYRNFPIPTILKGAEQSTEWVQSHDGLHEFKGSIFTGVDGAEGVEFVILQVNKINKEKDISIPWQMFVFVKSNAEGERAKTEQEKGGKENA